MQVERCGYFVQTNQYKSNGERLNPKDLITIGYLAGRCGINLDGNPQEPNEPKFVHGVKFEINSCTKDLFEKELNEAGIKFDAIV